MSSFLNPLTFMFCEDMETMAIRENLAYAWHRWELESCIERNGKHLWELEVTPLGLDPDDAEVDLSCSYCPATVDDLHPDGMEYLQGESDGFRIQDGKSLSSLPFHGSVRAEVIVKRYPANPSHGDEYDAWIEVSNV